MRPAEPEKELRRRLGLRFGILTPRRAVDVMLSFYSEVRAEGVLIEEDSDMLLYQWSIYGFTEPKTFEFDLTRQFLLPDEDEPYQLSLTLHFAATETLRVVGDGNRWCASPNELPEFRQFIESSAAFRAVADTSPTRVELDLMQC